jgi:hypothetical protein
VFQVGKLFRKKCENIEKSDWWLFWTDNEVLSDAKRGGEKVKLFRS